MQDLERECAAFSESLLSGNGLIQQKKEEYDYDQEYDRFREMWSGGGIAEDHRGDEICQSQISERQKKHSDKIKNFCDYKPKWT